MSRIGKQPIPVPSGVDVTIDGPTVTVKGPKGELKQTFSELITIEKQDDTIVVTRPDDGREARSLHGLTRTLVANMVQGVSEGFSKNLEIVGVGYRAVLKGSDLELALGFSHPVVVNARARHHLRGARAQPHHRSRHRQAARGSGRCRDPRVAQARAVQGQGCPLRG